MKILHISDTHGSHNLLEIPLDLDMIIFSGDESTSFEKHKNLEEFNDFFNWFKRLNVKHKIFIAGNHSIAIERGLIDLSIFIENNIHYLNNSYVTINGLKFYGSPIVPTFGKQNWVYMKSRDKMFNYWNKVDTDVDIFISHGPPKTILDLSFDINNKLEFCGDLSLYKIIRTKVKPILHCFGHLHNNDIIKNSGIKKIPYCDTVFSNGAVVEDGKFGKTISDGNLFEIDIKNKRVKII